MLRPCTCHRAVARALFPLSLLTITLSALLALAPAAGAQTAPRAHAVPRSGGLQLRDAERPRSTTRASCRGRFRCISRPAASFPRTGKILFALTGGPGQPGVDFCDLGRRASLAPALRQYRLVTLDQRGTGKSGGLRCPQVQALRDLDAFLPATVAGCASQIGPRRAFYTTADTVLDLE